MDRYVITIARGYGSGGKTIGKMLSEELGINYYNRELIRLASDDSGIHERLFSAADERAKLSMLFRREGAVYKGGLIPPESADFVSDQNLFNYQARIIRKLAEHESCVIIGRCADYVLRDYPNVVRVFVYAPHESCVKTVMDMFSVSEKEAEKTIRSIDRHRSAYYKYYTGNDWENAKNYDLCLNSAQLGFEKCVRIVKEYLKIRFD
ncbi:MAG TPA: cytidylate kinase-like family protein [Candidatus Caccomorpha excrementavium]|nr:cytidylate kinase-like family protein [Candidatus Caccomorpha excrementavium]